MKLTPQQAAGMTYAQLLDASKQGQITRVAADRAMDPGMDQQRDTFRMETGPNQYQAINSYNPDGSPVVGEQYTPESNASKFGKFAALAGGMGLASGMAGGGDALWANMTGASSGAPMTQGQVEQAFAQRQAANRAAMGIADGGWSGAAGVTTAPVSANVGGVVSGAGQAATQAAAQVAAPATGGGFMSGLAANPGAALMGVGAIGQLAGQSSPPGAPDFTQTAQNQADQQAALNQQTTQANRYNENTPYGSRTWEQDPNNPNSWTSNTTLSPEQQGLFDQENALSKQYGQTASNLMTSAQDTLSKPFDWNADSRQGVEDAIYGSYTSRLDPRFAREDEALQTRLANQGLTPGTEAYSNAMQDYTFGRNDAYQNAMNQSVIGGQSEANNVFNRELTQYQQPLNSLNALRSGSQATVPNFGPGAQQAQTQAPNLTGAAQAQYGATADQYNASQANKAGFWGGLMDIGSTMYRYK